MAEEHEVKLAANQLLERFRANDTALLREIYTDHFNACWSKIRQAGGTREDCREVFQEALYSLLVKTQNPEFELKTSFRGYLVQSCFYLWLKARKQQQLWLPLFSQEFGVDPGTTVLEGLEEKDQLLMSMYVALRKISSACRRVLELFFLEKRSDKFIAASMGYSVQFVKNKRQRCLKTLRSIIDKTTNS